MDTQEYSERALALANRDIDPFLHATLGISGESGEITDTVKKWWAYGKPLDCSNLMEELGDLAWYMNLMIAELDETWDEVFARNIAKLEARYPDRKFNADRAINRDLEAEQAAMRG